MKIVIEKEELAKLISMYIKGKLKCDVDVASAYVQLPAQPAIALSDIDGISFYLKDTKTE